MPATHPAKRHQKAKPALHIAVIHLPRAARNFSGHHRQRHRRFTRRDPASRLSAKAGCRCHLADAVLFRRRLIAATSDRLPVWLIQAYGTLGDFDELVAQA